MLKERLAGIPLRARLVAIIALLLAAGLGIAGIATTTVVSSFLVQQVDDELHTAALDPIGIIQSTSGQALPSDYYVLIENESGKQTQLGNSAITRFGTPELPTVTYDEAVDSGGEPFTAAAATGADDSDADSGPDTGTESWRVITLAATYPSGERAVVYVALPLVGMDKTVSILTRTLIMSGLGIVLLGGLTAWVLVERSLRSLRSVEHTAAQIAAGDLTLRVPEAPPGTEMGSLAASLNAMLTQIERAFAAQEASEVRMRQFVSDASHELRTPVATIRGYGELYRMGALDTTDKVDDTMFRIEDAARRMGTLVNDLLVLARLDEGRPVAREDVDLAALARDSAQDLHALDPTREVTVVPLGDGGAEAPGKLVVEGDGDRLRQVLTNLIGNVARHTPAGTPAEIALGVPDDPASDGAAVLEVRDHGPGLTEEQGRRIFERFYRADSSRTRESGGGSGLGMAIVAAIVGTHGGHVEVAQTPGGGLTVRLTLPLSTSDADVVAAEP
ncbi:HAMP domain-containing sensor histidine kinase [Promicromonospora sukumoe]|uniref:histidine kinase n=1 Tax=Promicromonospora sukumoe TaxID=88382 RepID=A0A7W3JCM5_9MICO|nr:HAMP domain-containing sensor histidine kinase [Promicromonospora sukumoe]MBA8810368.1 two-component system OmpR family sensor kinase [Promicromonospora sukumoe]